MFFISLKYVCHFRLQVADTGEYTCAPQGPGLQNKTVFLEVNQVVQRYSSTLYPYTFSSLNTNCIYYHFYGGKQKVK